MKIWRIILLVLLLAFVIVGIGIVAAQDGTTYIPVAVGSPATPEIHSVFIRDGDYPGGTMYGLVNDCPYDGTSGDCGVTCFWTVYDSQFEMSCVATHALYGR